MLERKLKDHVTFYEEEVPDLKEFVSEEDEQTLIIFDDMVCADKKTNEKIPPVASRAATRRVEMPPRKTLPEDVSLIQYIRAVVHQAPRRKADWTDRRTRNGPPVFLYLSTTREIKGDFLESGAVL